MAQDDRTARRSILGVLGLAAGTAAALLGAVQFTVGALVAPAVGLLGNDAVAMGAVVLAALLLAGCFDNKKPTTETAAPEQEPLAAAPALNADSAYAYVARQVAFGPRVPNSAAHVRTGDWLVREFRRHGLSVRVRPPLR